MKTTAKSISLKFDALDLPTAEHKAGLAGLCLVVQSMQREKITTIPQVEYPTDTTVVIRLTEAALVSLYDHFFSAIDVDGKTVPQAKYLSNLGMPESWVQLWRFIVAKVLRAGAPAQMQSFRSRLVSNRSRSTDASKVWAQISEGSVNGLSASDAVGFEGKNAERVPFKGSSDLNLLLTFWPVTSVPFVTSILKRPLDGKTKNFRFQKDAFVFAIPEISKFSTFVEEYPQFLSEDLDSACRGESKFPIASYICSPEESALRFLATRRLTSGAVLRFPFADLVSQVHIAQVKYGKGSPDILMRDRLELGSQIIAEYSAISLSIWNPIVRSRRIANLIAGRRWYAGFDDEFSTFPAAFFISIAGETPDKLASFGRDINNTFVGIIEDSKHRKGNEPMREPEQDQDFAKRIYKLIWEYVSCQIKKKTSLDYEAFQKGNPGTQKQYREAREQVTRDAFLAMRGRREQDFIEYFIGTVCSVPHFLPENEYVAVTEALLNETDRVKTLSMLALSAHSYLSESKKDKGESK